MSDLLISANEMIFFAEALEAKAARTECSEEVKRGLIEYADNIRRLVETFKKMPR